MGKRIQTITRISFFLFTLFIISSSLSLGLVEGVVDFNKKRSINPDVPFTHTIKNYKNRRYTITTYLAEEADPTYTLIVYMCLKDDYEAYRNGTIANITNIESLLFYNSSVEKGDILTYERVIPDWERWVFVFENPNPTDLEVFVRIERRHILWWLWIVLPTIVILGLVAYYVTESVLKYERAKMDSEKALNKLGSNNEGERKRGAYWLINNGTKEDLLKLEELLDDLEHPLIRSNTALAIGGISKRLDDNTLTDTLEQHLKTETNEDVKEAIVYALSDIADESSLDIFHEYIKLDHNEVLRFHIAKALTEIASEKSAKVLFDIIKGKNTETLKLQCERALNEISEKNDVSRDKLEKKYG